jgi:hypothetical protein
VRVIIKGQFHTGFDVLYGEEGEVVEPFVTVVAGDCEHFAVWVAGVVDEAGRGAKVAAIDDIDCVVVDEEVEAEEV